MADKPVASTLVDTARNAVLATVRTLYFPEIWYAIENHFALALEIKARRALEIGYGVGMVSEAFAKSGWDSICVDPWITALAALKTRFDRAGLTGTFEQAEPDTLPFSTGVFPYVVAINTLEFSANPEGVVREISRVLSPGGKAVVATFNKYGPWGLPPVARMLRLEGTTRTVRCFSKKDFVTLLENHRLNISDILERACYLPTATRVSRIKLPVAGAFVALVHKK